MKELNYKDLYIGMEITTNDKSIEDYDISYGIIINIYDIHSVQIKFIDNKNEYLFSSLYCLDPGCEEYRPIYLL